MYPRRSGHHRSPLHQFNPFTASASITPSRTKLISNVSTGDAEYGIMGKSKFPCKTFCLFCLLLLRITISIINASIMISTIIIEFACFVKETISKCLTSWKLWKERATPSPALPGISRCWNQPTSAATMHMMPSRPQAPQPRLRKAKVNRRGSS